jgi:hemerythrin
MRTALEWTESLSVGVEEIDEQHRELFRRAGRLLDGLRRGEADEIAALIEYLHEYAVTHFGAEEAFMREKRYAGYARHKAEHDGFISKLLAVAGEHDRKGAGAFLAVKMSHWLAQWLENHVSVTDAELGKFLTRRSA